MRKFKCVVTRVDEYEIEIDDKKFNEEWMRNFKECMYDFDTYENHAEHIAQFRARFGCRFIEGYGTPLENSKKPFFVKDEEVEKGININIISEDNDCEVEVEEIN